MADYRLSARAVTDLAEIADYTVATFGVEQARRYRDDLESCFEYLADNPLLGRSAESLAPGLRRFEHRSHAIFYTKERGGVLIVRILHTRMTPGGIFLPRRRNAGRACRNPGNRNTGRSE